VSIFVICVRSGVGPKGLGWCEKPFTLDIPLDTIGTEASGSIIWEARVTSVNESHTAPVLVDGQGPHIALPAIRAESFLVVLARAASMWP
jgi:hypothetical protein